MLKIRALWSAKSEPLSLSNSEFSHPRVGEGQWRESTWRLEQDLSHRRTPRLALGESPATPSLSLTTPPSSILVHFSFSRLPFAFSDWSLKRCGFSHLKLFVVLGSDKKNIQVFWLVYSGRRKTTYRLFCFRAQRQQKTRDGFYFHLWVSCFIGFLHNQTEGGGLMLSFSFTVLLIRSYCQTLFLFFFFFFFFLNLSLSLSLSQSPSSGMKMKEWELRYERLLVNCVWLFNLA